MKWRPWLKYLGKALNFRQRLWLGSMTCRMGRGPSRMSHPNIAETYRKKVALLAEALNQPAERDEAATAIRALIENVVLTPGAQRGEMHATLLGELGVILDWLGERPRTQTTTPPALTRRGCEVSLGAVGCGSRI
ncbi:MAG: hypothetical protein P0Y50_00005 [Candidatus Brevundimonas colombiensis]|uniref:Uncharacterized protein n=1 Tax=Candidatus Brevundimonas colombiensis TaxID=3121376 RepID=A0AAJ6BL66_9CAUL|nr:hypothetical protein [Brevundimonas sp.]WEK40027.1 MAG: hypothetical protein P0Y50_00005 [Brevundimonas sp.]